MAISLLTFLIVLTSFWLAVLLIANSIDLKRYGVYVSPLFILLKFDRLGDLAFWIGDHLGRPLEKADRAINVLGLAMFFALPISLVINLFIPSSPIFSVVPITALTLENLLLFVASLFLAMIIHELAHASVAFAKGIEVEAVGIGILGFLAVAFTQFPKVSLPSITRKTRTTIIVGGIIANISVVALLIPITFFSEEISSIGYERRPGALIISVDPLSPAEKANITTGTVITGISTLFGGIRTNSEIVGTHYDLINYLRQTPPDSRIELSTNKGNFIVITEQNKLFPNGSTIGVTVYYHYVSKISGSASAIPFYFNLFVHWMLNVNLFLALFNLLPFPYSDGQQLLEAIVPSLSKLQRRAIYFASAILLVANLLKTVPAL